MTAKKETELRVLLSKRDHAFASVNIMFEMAKSISEDRAGLSSFLLRVKRLENIKESFYDLTDKINTLSISLKPDEQVDVKPLLEFDDLYYQILETADSLGYIDSNDTQSVQNPTSEVFEGKVHLRLPQIDLPKFDGQIENWPTFIDVYLPLIHNNKSISDIEKFHYLVSSLSGSALSIAKNIPLTAANYLIVFNALRDRFDNKRILATAYLDKIYRLKPMSSSSFNELSKVTSTLSECVNALAAMNVPNMNEFILFYIASRSLDLDTRQKFEEQNSKVTELPTCEQLLKYFQNQLRILEFSKSSNVSSIPKPAANQVFSRPMQSTDRKPQAHFNRSFVASNHNPLSEQAENSQSCPCCSLQHSIYKCDKFKSMDVQSRHIFVSHKRLCFNCLRSSHSSNNCLSKTSCFCCGKRHNTMLHTDDTCHRTHVISESVKSDVTSSVASNDQTSSLACASSTMQTVNCKPSNTIKLLGTAMIRLRDKDGYILQARALLDSCSHDCIMTTSCAQRIGLPIQQNYVSVAGVGGNIVTNIQGVTSCTVLPLNRDAPQFDLDFVVMSKITSNMPIITLPRTVRQQFEHLDLADPSFDTASNVDILLGVDIFDKIYDGQRFAPGPEFPVALNSIFGWVLTGRVIPSAKLKAETSSTFLVASNANLENILQRFWEVEEPPYKRILHPDDDICEKIYTNNMYRESNGRYVVPIMVKEDQRLGDSYHRSLNRFLNLERRLTREPGLKEDYTKFLKEYKDLGHMQPCDSNTLDAYLIPHHCVIRPSNVTTKLRVVFDASCKTTNNQSLNDIVYTGPKLQVDVIDITTKFRLHAIVFTADMCKMYRQILIVPEDRHFQHILWRDSNDQSIQEFELNTVTYGVRSSPYLAIRTIRQLASDHGNQFPRAAEVLCEETFMDDIITGAATVDSAIKLRDDIISLLKLGQLELRKWSSNNVDLLEDLPLEHCQLPKSFSNGNVDLKVLGIKWDPKGDHFSYSVLNVDIPFTKRGILSVIAKVYDPLGWISPAILTAKLLMQELWQLQISWDDSIPDYLIKRWHKFASQLKDLESIQFPRFILPIDVKEIHIVGFCDGSSKGYGCCVYLVARANNQTRVNLLIGKSKVAPLKTLTINRLELCGAVLLAQVINHMYILLKDKINIDSVRAYSDSSTVLSWINTEPCQLKMYVANRVIQIRDSLDIISWRHVSTHDNPADCCSRGISVSELISHPLWWHGPTWLELSSSVWPSQNITPLSDLPELKINMQPTQFLLVTHSDDDFISNFVKRFSSFSKMQRTFAWVLRFVQNLKLLRKDRKIPSLSIDELSKARLFIIKEVQTSYFKEVFHCVQQSIPCIKSIQKLAPFIDSLGLLRVGGRLINSNLPETAKHPILLPKKSVLSTLLIDYFHRVYLHSGPRTLQSLIIRDYWILGIRLLIRSRLSKCVTCFKVRPVSSAPVMGNLPALRLQPTNCFESVGIDFGGPFLVKESKRRNARTYKAYICLFVCLSVKAIHLEAVTELSTEAFIAALDRFVARRGICKNILTDCGTNFVGAKRYLNEMFELVQENQSHIMNYLTERNISWNFNPPGAPHFGGIFESGIRSTKHHLRRVVGTQVLTLEEMFTILSKIEAMLNSRPLCALSTCPLECDVLTPGHFLIGRPLVALPESPLNNQFLSLHNRWKMIKRLTQQFWYLWQRDYLHTLQQRMKWLNQNKNICIGDLVIIKDNNLPPLQWKLGKIVETFVGNDNVIRVASVRTGSGFLKRPVVKLCPLPLG